MVKGNDGSLLFKKELLVMTPGSLSSQQSSSESTAAAPRPPQKKKAKRLSLLTSIDPRNIIDITDNEDAPSTADTPPTSSMPASSYSFRNRRAARGKLIYDVKYHPMDDSIRPSQAAKRRSAHGEEQVSSDDSSEASVQGDGSDLDEEKEGKKEEEQKSRPAKKGKKRARSPSQSPEPTRRSSRRTATLRVSYNMSIHPQDRDLEESSADDSDDEAAAPGPKRKTSSRSVTVKSPSRQHGTSMSVTQGRTGVSSPTLISSEPANVEDDEPADKADEPADIADEPATLEDGERDDYYNTSCERDGEMTLVEEQDTNTKTSSSPSYATTPPPFGIRRKEGLDVWLQEPGERYFRHDRDSWPSPTESGFEIHTDSRLTDHLEVEADVLSPLNFPHDDKENEVDSAYEATQNFLDGISVIPASQYRLASEDRHAAREHLLATGAFYDAVHTTDYGLGGSDGANDQDDATTAKSKSNVVSVTASGDQLPRSSDMGKQANDDIDSVLGASLSTASEEVDSVCGSRAAFYATSGADMP